MAQDGGPGAPAPTGGLSDDVVSAGFRLLAGRDPATPAEFAAFKALPNVDAMRQAFTNLPEFHAFFSAILTGYPTWTMPLLLLRPPAVPGLDWRFEPPTLETPGSQLCTHAQFADPVFTEIMEAMAVTPSPTRPFWEQAWIIAMLAHEGLIAPGVTALTLGLRRERLAALLASRGMRVVAAVNAPDDPARLEGRRVRLFYPEIIAIEDFDQLVGVAQAEPGRPDAAGLEGFDCCVSIGTPLRAASVVAAMEAIERSLATLRPGGLALHTMALNISADTLTWDLPNLVIPRRKDIEALAGRLQAAGHTVLRLNTHPGCDIADEQMAVGDAPPPLRQRLGTVVATSFGLAIRKAA